MKRAVIGGFISLIGILGVLAVFIMASNNLAGAWGTPPGRFLTTVSGLGMMPVLITASAVLCVGLIIMGIEYMKEDAE